ncbi:MAG: AI-2E family transporter [Muribaculaceae bacterium]
MVQTDFKRIYTFDKVVRIIFSTLVIVGIVWLLNYLRGVLLPFLVACLIAYIIHPFVKWNSRFLHIKNNTLAVLVSLFELIIVLGGVLAVLIPYIVNEISQMADMFAQYTQNHNTAQYLPPEIHELIVKYINFESIKNMLTHEQIMTIVENALIEAWDLMSSGVSVILSICSWIVVVLYLVFILIDYDKMSRACHLMVPKRYRKSAFKVFNDVETSMNHYFRGQALIAFIVGVLFSIGFLIVGLPMAVVFGLFIGLLNMVPYLQLVSIPIAAILCIVQSVSTGTDFWMLLLGLIAVYCVVQAIQDLYLTPRIMGKYMGLNPAIIFLSLSIWGSLLGFIGLIIALPLTSLIISYYDRYVIHRDGAETGPEPESHSPAE